MKLNIVNRLSGFTIVELLVVIVVIGILASITVVSYAGISNQAIMASLKSDLVTASRQFKLYNVEYGTYPTAIAETSSGSGVWCASAPTPNDVYCLRLSSGNLKDSYVGTFNTFKLIANNGNNYWSISESASPVALTVPILINPTSTAVTSSGATIGATVASDGGYPITEIGTCWGESANPTDNCLANELGVLLPASAASAGTQTNSVAISIDGRSAYASNGNSNTISMYSRDANTGALTALSTPTIATGSGPFSVIVSNDGKSVYVNNNGSNTISMYSRDANTGALTALSTPTIATGSNAVGLISSNDGLSVYAVNEYSNSVSMYSRDAGTGLLTNIGSIATGVRPKYITISIDGASVYVTNFVNATSNGTISTYSRNATTGLLTNIGSIATGKWPSGITISLDSKSVYAVNGNVNTISMYSRNTGTGLLTSTGSIATSNSPLSIVISPDGSSVYVTNNASSTVSMYSRNISSGALSLLSAPAASTGNSPYGLAISSDGKFVYTSNYFGNNISAFSRNNNDSSNVGFPFNRPRTGMPSSKLIYYRGYAKNKIGTGYSPDSTFTTL